MKTKPATEFALLGVLMAGPMHGYEIMQFMESELGSAWYVSPSQLYTLLKKMEDKALLQSAIHRQTRRPAKRVFRLTTGGRTAFLEWLHEPVEHVRDLRIEFPVKLFFLKRYALKDADTLIERQIQRLERKKEQIVSRVQEADRKFNKLLMDARLAAIEAWLQWLRTKAKRFIRKGETITNAEQI